MSDDFEFWMKAQEEIRRTMERTNKELAERGHYHGIYKSIYDDLWYYSVHNEKDYRTQIDQGPFESAEEAEQAYRFQFGLPQERK